MIQYRTDTGDDTGDDTVKGTNRKKASRYVRNILLAILVLFLLFVLTAGTVYCVKGYRMYETAVKEKPIATIADTIRSREGFTKYEDLPPIYIDAVISAEDKRFENHCGIDVWAIARAAWMDIRTLSFAEGGSTITQQIAKNELFTQEKRVERKFAEIFAALELEKEYTKQELFEIYVNSIYFGSGYYGIFDAAQGYFQKNPEDLTDYEAVMLAGIPNAPSVYSLDKNMELAEKRMSVVLKRMIKCGKITEEEAAEILNGKQVDTDPE